MQMSTLDSYQHSSNRTILCTWQWERCRPSVWKRLQNKKEKEKNGTSMYNLSLMKSSLQRKTAMKSKIVSTVLDPMFACFSLDFP